MASKSSPPIYLGDEWSFDGYSELDVIIDYVVYGEGGDDTLMGWTGDDPLSGGIGDDWLYGGGGNDYL